MKCKKQREQKQQHETSANVVVYYNKDIISMHEPITFLIPPALINKHKIAFLCIHSECLVSLLAIANSH